MSRIRLSTRRAVITSDARQSPLCSTGEYAMQQPTADSARAPCLNHTRRSTTSFFSKRLKLIAILVGILVAGTAPAESLSDAALVATLRQGGCVLLIRHASSPPTLPTAASAEPGNIKLERQLDETGRSSALAMGEAIKTLTIPVGDVWSSPTYRAQQTARLANLPAPALAAELGDGERSMQAITNGQTVWLQGKLAELPRAGTNTIIVTQFPNIVGAFGQKASGLAEGDALVLRPTGTGEYEIVGRVKIQEWPSLAAQR